MYESPLRSTLKVHQVLIAGKITSRGRWGGPLWVAGPANRLPGSRLSNKQEPPRGLHNVPLCKGAPSGSPRCGANATKNRALVKI